jgi:hypothetical protein
MKLVRFDPPGDYMKERDSIICGIEGLGSQRCVVQAAVSSMYK